MFTSITFVALFAALVATSPLRVHSSYAVKETHPVPPKWEIIGDAPANHIISLQIGLKQSQFDELERHLYEGKSFGHHSMLSNSSDCA